MNLETKDIVNILASYDIHSEIDSFTYFINGYNEETAELKMIVRVNFHERTPLVIKCIREDEHPNNIIEEQSCFSEQLRGKGILTPKRYLCGNYYCSVYKLGDLILDITVEDYFGEEIKVIDKNLAYKIGRLMGENHRIAEENSLHISAKTIFNVTGYNEVSGYETFKEFGNSGFIEKDAFDRICALYDEKLDRIKSVWGNLPKYATQGDYSVNNLVYIDNEIGIFDYNIAGDETLIGDMILEGLLTANEMDLAEGLTESDRLGLFKEFVRGYVVKRPLLEKEKDVFNDIYTISQALWFTKIKYRDTSLSKLIKNNETEKIRELVEKIYHDIACEGFTFADLL